MNQAPPTVDTLSGEISAMQADIELIGDIRAGLPAMRRGSATYLPRYAKEDREEYARRVSLAPWRPEFANVLLTLASKPFSQPVTLPSDTPEPIRKFAEDVDGKGNNLHTFARSLFLDAMANGVSLLYVAFPDGPAAKTVAEEKAAGRRPYWVNIPLSNVVALYTENRSGETVVTHLRVMETVTERDGFGEKTTRQVRVFEPGKWELYKEVQRPVGTKSFELAESGVIRNAKGLTTSVQLVTCFTGERTGHISTRSPLRDLADMQVELFRALSRQEEILTYAGSPMLAANGVSPPIDGGSLSIGPKSVLFAPANSDGKSGSWSYVQPDAAVLREVREQLQSIMEDMQRLGMQPMLDRSGDVSAAEASIMAAKAHSALESWALNLKDALEQAFALTLPWFGTEEQKAIGDHEVTVNVRTDFSGENAGSTEANLLLQAAKQGIISRLTTRDEFARRGILGPGFDAKTEDTRFTPNELRSSEETGSAADAA